MIDQRYLKTSEAAKYLGIKIADLRRWAQQGRVPYSRPGGKIMLFDLQDLDKFMVEHRGK